MSNELTIFLETAIIPTIQSSPKTFLEIAKQPHYENVLSNIYAFFFNIDEEHGLKDLFIKSLKELIDESKIETKDLSNFAEFAIETEYSTKKGGRIDLLLYNSDEAIIIENKVKHDLDNDLDDYWESVNVPSIQHKIGILLTLKHISKDVYRNYIYSKEYINITHLELMNRVMLNKKEYLEKASKKYILFMDDLYENVQKMSRSFMKEKDLAFYYENQQQINTVFEYRNKVKEHIVSEIENTGDRINGVVLKSPIKTNSNRKRLRYYASKKVDDLMITVLFDRLLNHEKKIVLIVELRGNALRNKERFKGVHSKYVGTNNNFFKDVNKHWAHFAVAEYDITQENLAGLGDFITKTLVENQFMSIFKDLEEVLSPVEVN
jgi:hypothetical protein